MAVPSFFYAPLLFPFIISISFEIITQLWCMTSAIKLLFKAGYVTQPQFWLIWRQGTAFSGSKFFFLYSAKYDFPEIAACRKFGVGVFWGGGIYPLKTGMFSGGKQLLDAGE